MFRKSRKRRQVPGINTTSTADISFMLLVFFLITTSIDTDKGMMRQLPPPTDNKEATIDVKRRNVLVINIDGNDMLTCDGERIAYDKLQERIEAFVDDKSGNADKPEIAMLDIPLIGKYPVAEKHVIAIETDSATTYDAYFKIQNSIVAAYGNLRNQLAIKQFGKPLAECSAQQREAVAACYPQRISETLTTQKGGSR